MPSKKPLYTILVTSGTLEVEADRNSIAGCMEFLRQVKKVGYVEGIAQIKSNRSNQVLTQIILEDD
jgi:hypothetical protein|tara:strand:+ start:1894 stop:2091 length:198 start_codon:yes stop_codon:yes gene_type:complete